MTSRAQDPVLLSVVVPMLDEQEVLPELHRRLEAALEGFAWELIAVDDGSSDATPMLLDELSARDPRVTAVHLTRSWGHQAALTAGMDAARGDVVVTIDADLQDPPELIPALVEQWRAGNDIVRAVRGERTGEPRWRLTAIGGFYRLLGRWTGVDYAANTGDFRLMDRRAVDVVRAMPERARYLRGMTAWTGFASADVSYQRDPRLAGETKYPIRKLVRFAIDGLTSFSHVPLRLASYLGFFFAALAFLGLPLAVIARVTGIYVPGIATVIILVCFLGGVQLLTLGIVGEYLGRMYDELKRRPLYLVRDVVVRGEHHVPTTHLTPVLDREDPVPAPDPAKLG
ncbi:MAG: glycosyltransferase family 2 protein [Solirubrobacterales bacterium]|nr:glycosyltransferase family 2 protein [Solirubrobacterales bacterium]